MLQFRRVVGIGVAGALLLTNVVATHAVEKSLWEERRAAVERSPRFARLLPSTPGPLSWENQFFGGGSTTSQPPSNFKNLALPFDVASAVLPFGAIGEVYEGRRGAPVVFLVQDVHGNDGAQKNIGGILDGLAAQGITLAGVEGAWGPLDLDAYHRHPSPHAVSLVAEALRSSGRLSGAEWAGLTSRRPPTLVGVETPHLYHANVAAARACVARRPVVAEFLRTLTSNLKILKDRVYSHTLKEFDFHREAYQDSQESLGDFARYLSELPGASNLSGPQVKIFLKAIEWENRLNFDEIEKDRQHLMERISIELDQGDLNALLARAVDFRTGKATNGDFYLYLKRLCKKRAISLDAYRAFTDYMAFVGLVQTIHRGELLNDLASWEFSLGAGLASSVEEKNLLSIDRDISLLRRLLENEMSPEAWAMYGKRKEKIADLPDRLKGVFEFPEPAGGLVPLIQPHEDFCRLAMERDEALAANLRAVVQSKKATAAALVSGGFHTPGLQAQLHKQGWSTIVVTPRVEKVEGKPLDVFARDPLPFDQLFAGKPISLSAELMLGNVSQKKLMGGEMTAEALRLFPVGRSSDDLKEWLEEQGFEVASMARSSNSLARIEVVFRGIEMVLLAGTKDSIDSTEIPDGSERNIISLPNGDYLLSYVDSSSPFPQWRFGYFKKVFDGFYQLFVQWGKKIVPLARGSILNHNHGMRWLSSIFYPIWLVLEMKIVPDGQSSGFPVVSRTPNENATMEISSSGLAVRLTLRDRSGNSVGSALAAGKRGDVVLSSVEISPGNNDYIEDLLEGVAKEFLVLKGQGRIRLTGVSDPRVKHAAQRFFDDETFRVAPQKFGRTSTSDQWLDTFGVPHSSYFALMDGSVPVDMIGSLSIASRRSLWPKEDLPFVGQQGELSPWPKVEFTPSQDGNLIAEYQRLGIGRKDICDVKINGVVVGACVYSTMPKGVWLKDIHLLETERGNGHGMAIYVALAKKAALVLNPARNQRGAPVPFEGRNLVNPFAQRIRKKIYIAGSMELVDVGPRFMDETFEPPENWENPVKEGTPEFVELVGESNLVTHGPDKGKYLRHFDSRGEIIPEIVKAAERELLLEQRENPLNFKSSVQDRSGGDRFEISREGSGVTISMFDSEGRRVGSLVLLGTRGEVTLTGIRIKTKKQEHVNALLLEAARMALFEGGEGRLYIPRVEDENLVRAALSLFDGSTLLVAKSKTGRSKKERNWKDRMDPSDEEGILGLLRSPYQTVDMSGSLSLEVRSNMWPGVTAPDGREEANGRTLPPVDVVKVNGHQPDTYWIYSEGEKVGSMIAKVQGDVVVILKTEVDKTPVDLRGRGFGSAGILYFAKEAARIIHPRKNADGIDVPLERRNVVNPWIFKHAMEDIYDPDSIEIVEVGTDWPLFEKTEASDWATVIRKGDPRFDFLTTNPRNINAQGNYIIRFHMRGKLHDRIVDAARKENAEQYSHENRLAKQETDPNRLLFSSYGLSLWGMGDSFYPILGSLLAVALVVATMNRERILKWLVLNEFPSWVRNGVLALLPDPSPFWGLARKMANNFRAWFSQVIDWFRSRRSMKLTEAPASSFPLDVLPLRANPMAESDASEIFETLANALGLGEITHETVMVGGDNVPVEYDEMARLERVGRLFFINAETWSEHQELLKNIMGLHIANLVVLPLETYSWPRSSFLSEHSLLMVANLLRMDLSGRTVLDLGTGQGTLALAALKLGAKRVVAVDHSEVGGSDLFREQGVRLGTPEDDPSDYDILLARARIQKPAPPALRSHVEAVDCVVANVGPTYPDYFEMVDAWSKLPNLTIWLDGGQFSETVRDMANSFVRRVAGWEVYEISQRGEGGGDYFINAPAVFEARRIPVDGNEQVILETGRHLLAELNNPDFSAASRAESSLLELPDQGGGRSFPSAMARIENFLWQRLLSTEGTDPVSLRVLRAWGILSDGGSGISLLPNLARLELALWAAADQSESVESLGFPVRAFVVGGSRILHSENRQDVDVLLSYEADDPFLQEWIQPATVRAAFFENLSQSLPFGATLASTAEGATVSWTESGKSRCVFHLNVHPVPGRPVDAVTHYLRGSQTNYGRSSEILKLERTYFLGSLDRWGEGVDVIFNQGPLKNHEGSRGDESEQQRLISLLNPTGEGLSLPVRYQLESRLSRPASLRVKRNNGNFIEEQSAFPLTSISHVELLLFLPFLILVPLAFLPFEWGGDLFIESTNILETLAQLFLGGTIIFPFSSPGNSPRVDDFLSQAERQVLRESLLSLSPRPFEAMPPLKEITLESWGGEVDRVTDIPESLSSNVSLARMMRVAQGEKIALYRKIALYSASLSDDRGKRTAAQAGANAAVFDEVKYPWAQNMDWAFIQNLVSSIVSAGGAVGARLSVFQSAYNSVRSRIWRGRLIGATLASTNGLVLNISPLFEANQGDVGPGVEEALIQLGIALDHEIGSGKPPIELLVDIPLDQQVVEDRLIDLIPGWHNLKNSRRLNLRVRGKDGDVFKEGGISLMTLHSELSLTVVGISEKQLVAEEVLSLHKRGMTLLPWLEILTKNVEKALKKLVFLRIMA